MTTIDPRPTVKSLWEKHRADITWLNVILGIVVVVGWLLFWAVAGVVILMSYVLVGLLSLLGWAVKY